MNWRPGWCRRRPRAGSWWRLLCIMCWRGDVGIFKGARVELSDMGTQESEGERGRRESLEIFVRYTMALDVYL